MAEPIEVNVPEMQGAISQLTTDIAGINSIAGKVKFEITKNTCTSVTKFKTAITTDITTSINNYIANVTSNLQQLANCLHIVDDVQNMIKNSIIENTTSARQRDAEAKANTSNMNLPYNYSSPPTASYNTQPRAASKSVSNGGYPY